MRLIRMIPFFGICFTVSLLGLSGVKGQASVDIKGIKRDLTSSIGKLTKHRDSVTEEKVALSGKVAAMQAELIRKRRMVKLAALGNADRKVILGKLEGEASARVREVSYLSDQLGSFRSKVESGMYKGETLKAEYEPADDSLTERMKVLEAGIERLEEAIGGVVVDSEVANSEGKILQGKLVSFGPSYWFSDAAGGVTGAVVVDRASRNARLIETGDEAIVGLIRGDEVVVDVDLTGGKARALASISNTPLELFSKGGAWIWPIVFVAIVSLVCAILKFFQLSKIKNPRGGWLSGLLDQVREGNISDAQASCESINHPVGVVMKNALSGIHKGADVVEEIVYEQMIDVQSGLQKWLPFIAITAAIAPLLGLLGTVSGMISTFSALSVVGTGDPKLLSGGISEALVTTLFGLIVAIPALILHSLLSRRSQGISQMTEKIGLTVVNCIRKK